MLALCSLLASCLAMAREPDAGANVSPVFSAPLGSAGHDQLTVVRVHYAPGGRSPAHHHAGAVYAYVLEGAVRSENSATGAVRIYHAGEGFFEPAGSVHKVSANASDAEPATLLVTFVAPSGAALTTLEQ